MAVDCKKGFPQKIGLDPIPTTQNNTNNNIRLGVCSHAIKEDFKEAL